ncbi:hypothetical protein A2153_04655 [Candidatus Gottesmanbacteria bacterium RBG_16_38_7b]|uniref:Phosphoglycerate dehydrogenase n=1 Tax=Candidatus Gottesmanbacteria bacterium RBG_16_38_7b TaxID=1798372 RepID=A0A1F5YIC4_9BACT|nr:MAG: hypothetical protein A2153_04655 [Candidatus Gottesmanbacteria bacterium RBG_16_38_7b]
MKLLITDKINHVELTPLKKYFDIDVRIGLSPVQLENIINEYECLITRSATKVPESIIDKADKLKIIARAGIGVDNIDIFAATRKKIAVINAPKGNARATAEHTIGLIFSLLRHIPQANRDLINGQFNKSKYTGFQIKGKTLGIVGFGNVGRQVCRMANGLDLKVIICEPYIRLPKKVRHVTYEELLKESDIITFHVPSTYLTKNMLNKNTLNLTKTGVCIINCSRGQVVNEKAVIEGLKNGKIKGFAVDVYKEEPSFNPELVNLPNVIATPHIAGSTHESQKQSVSEVVSGIISLIKNIPPPNLLNPQVFHKEIKTSARGKKIFEFDSVIFDCDSTLSKIEGIDELAGFYGKKEQISRLTRLAQEGKLAFEDVFQQRLNILKPSRQSLEELSELYLNNLTEDASQTLEALSFLEKNIYIISGSYTHALLKLANKFNIPSQNIYANDLIFDKKGNFIQYIEGPLKRNHGKLQIVRRIKGRKIMFGDGITDLETRYLVDLFVGFGGVQIRPVVEEESDIYIYNPSLSVALILAAGYNGAVKLLKTKYRKLVGKGIDLLSHPKHTKIKKGAPTPLFHFRQLAYL